ncbi:DUF726-domain-containing protein [Auriscalpium vulgare]|uniref:DUF726-domain-containing protein n=1 Tax=Auriscalpium vulgare TaxID=40419 RepID=A0ACB8SAA2_9AGAM|nr:DUF726-domain-containing protein [Auriscalpium vulgare]
MKSIEPPIESLFDADDDEGWEDMPIVREADDFAGVAGGLDDEDQKKYHYVPQAKKDLGAVGVAAGAGNATGTILDVDYEGQEWRSKVAAQNESEYTRLRMKEEEEADEVHLRTRYLFDEDQAMTPLSQMQQTKNMLTEAQRIAYVGLCALTGREMSERLKRAKSKELKPAIQNMELWALKILGRLYYHMELATAEQKMIENLSMHGVKPEDLVPSLMTTHTVANPEYDPEDAKRKAVEREEEDAAQALQVHEQGEVTEEPPPVYIETEDISQELVIEPTTPMASPSIPHSSPQSHGTPTTGLGKTFTTTSRVLEESKSTAMPGVSTSLSSADENVTLDIRWTVLCDLFLILIADSVYDARSRVLLEQVAIHLGLGWLDVVKFEQRVTEALEIQEGVENLEQREIVDGREKSGRRRRYMMMGLATLGGGLVIGLSAGLLAPVIGAGLGAAFTTIGISGTAGFLGGTAGAAVITTGGVLTGSSIAARGMAHRTQQVRTFEVLPLHNNKRVNCIVTVPGFMNGEHDDVRLPFSVLDPIVGDVFSVLWEPEMIRETGSALRILTTEVLTQIGQTVLQATVMTALMSALQWPIILTKLGYLIDNPWNNALDRAKAAGSVLADVLIKRHLGVRPVTLIGFSLGARVIFYALLEIAKQKAFGIVQDVFLMGATLTASQKTWMQVRSAASGRFVNAYARNDWVLNYLFRATSGSLSTVAGLRPVENIPGLENVDVTDKIAGHMSYRTFMPLILDQLGFPVSADHFDEPEEPDFEEDRIVVREGEEFPKKKSWFSRSNSKVPTPASTSRPPSVGPNAAASAPNPSDPTEDDLPPREVHAPTADASDAGVPRSPTADAGDIAAELPKHAGFDLAAMKAVIEDVEPGRPSAPAHMDLPPPPPFEASSALERAHSAPPAGDSPERTPTDEREVNFAGPSTSAFPAGAFSRSLSLNNIRRTDEEEEDEEEEDEPVQRAAGGPGLTFGGADGGMWEPVDDKREMFGVGNPFPPAFASTTSGALGAGASARTGFAGAAVVERDPWALPAASDAKKAGALTSNPWDS